MQVTPTGQPPDSAPSAPSAPPAPARRYSREPRVQRQLAALWPCRPDRITAAVDAVDAEPERRVAEEVLVALARRFHASGANETAWELAERLLARVQGRLHRVLYRWRLDAPPGVAEEVVEQIVGELYAAVFDGSERAAFWEIRFWVAFDRMVITTVRAKRAELDRRLLDWEPRDDEPWSAAADASGASARPSPSPRSASEQDRVVEALVVEEALERLPEPLRTAFVLKHVAGWPEESRGAGSGSNATIARALGVTGRTVRNYLRRADEYLAAWRAEGEVEASGAPLSE